MDFNSMLDQQNQKALDPNAYKEKSKYEVDERFYTISKDQLGCGKVKIRFVPSFNADKTGLQQLIEQQVHNVNWNKQPLNDKSEKRYWSGVCPKTKGPKEPCPICQYGFDEGGKIEKLVGDEFKNDPQQILRSKYYREFCSDTKRITNIMVLKDEINPSNEGKIFLFELKNSLYKMFAQEAEKVQNELADCSSEADRQARGIPKDLKGFNPYDLMNGKDMWIIYKSKKYTDNDPKNYWGHSYWDSIYTDKVNGNVENYKALVDEAYVLDEFVSDAVIPSQEFLEEKLAHLTFATSKGTQGQTVQTQAVPESQTQATHQATPDIQASSVDDVLNGLDDTTIPDTSAVEPIPTASPVQVEASVEPNLSETMSDDDLINSILNS